MDISSLASDSTGNFIFGDGLDDTPFREIANYPKRYRATFGFGHFGQRVYSRSYEFTPYRRSVVDHGGFAYITFASSTGALLGRIRTDIQNTIVQSLEFTVDQNGCAEFTLVLNDLPSFELSPMTIISVNVFQTEFDWFIGKIESAPLRGVRQNEYEYKGFGFRKDLSRLKAENIYSAVQDVGDIVDDITYNFIRGKSSIQYNTSKIEATGVLTASNNDLSTADLTKVLDLYAKMGLCDWGVDGNGALYFLKKNNHIQKLFWAGVTNFEVETNPDNIYNSIFVQRQDGKGSGGAGWAVAAIENDYTSQALYGLRDLPYQMTGHFGDDDCELVASRLLSEHSQPKNYVKLEKVLKNKYDYLERGTYTFVSSLSVYQQVATECDDKGSFVVINSDDEILADSSVMMSGASALSVTWTTSDAIITTPIDIRGSIRKLRLFARSDVAGIYATFGVGYGSWSHYTRELSIDVSGVWQPIELNLEQYSLTRLNQFGIQLHSGTNISRILIDKVEVDVVGSIHYEAELTKATYRFTPRDISVSAEFGPAPNRMYDYISSLMAQADENKFVSQRR